MIIYLCNLLSVAQRAYVQVIGCIDEVARGARLRPFGRVVGAARGARVGSATTAQIASVATGATLGRPIAL